MSASEFDIDYVARLARIQLSAEEQARFAQQLGHVLGHIDQLKQVDVSGVDPTAHAVPLTNVVRPDEPRESLTNEEALRNSPLKANGLFIVPKIVE